MPRCYRTQWDRKANPNGSEKSLIAKQNTLEDMLVKPNVNVFINTMDTAIVAEVCPLHFLHVAPVLYS